VGSRVTTEPASQAGNAGGRTEGATLGDADVVVGDGGGGVVGARVGDADGEADDVAEGVGDVDGCVCGLVVDPQPTVVASAITTANARARLMALTPSAPAAYAGGVTTIVEWP
jgi:hypothetical protein